MAGVSDTLINTLFDGRYRIVRKLGSGGMANVYLAEDEDLGRRVAIKILNDRYANDDLFIERFRREAKSAAGLSHPNIVSIYDRGEAEGTYYIAMEVIEGRSLKELILTRGALPVHQAVAYARQLLEALRFAHRHGIIHRDIKPHNVLVSADERGKSQDSRLKVTDFGIARHGASQMTEAGSIMGTAQYLSPEQARGAPVTAASDLYSAGIVLYEMLTGKVPFGGDSIEDLERVEAGLPISRETSEAATALLAAPLTGGTTEVLPGESATRVVPPPTRPQAPPRRPPPPEYRYDEPPRKRRRFLPWLLVLILLAAAGIAGWYVYNQIQEQLEAREPVGVPNVVGLQEERAVRLIENAELEPNVERQPSSDEPRGIVISQSPGAGVRIQKGDQVTIAVSSGPRQVEVPSVVGMNVDRAIQELDDAGLDWRTVEAFSEAPVNQVFRQNPQAGQTVDEGTRVTLRVSKGVETAVVPDVLDQSEDSARQELEAEGFEVQVNEAPSDETEEGLVSAQDPNPGVEAPVGSTVTITVSTGPEQQEVPNVVGDDEDSARQTLEDAGFRVQVEEQPTDDQDQDGLVFDQDPGGGTQADQGSTVTIFVARFAESGG